MSTSSFNKWTTPRPRQRSPPSHATRGCCYTPTRAMTWAPLGGPSISTWRSSTHARCNAARMHGDCCYCDRRYRYFVFLNSGVRGPFMPSWARTMRLHWVSILTSKLQVCGPAAPCATMPIHNTTPLRAFQEKVKMVGPTINCGKAFDESPVPHVQTYAFAVDRKVCILRDTAMHAPPTCGLCRAWQC